jgi:hypothetical protein
MRLMSTILFSSVVAFGAAGAMAEDKTVLPPAQAQAGPQGDHRGGPPGAAREAFALGRARRRAMEEQSARSIACPHRASKSQYHRIVR